MIRNKLINNRAKDALLVLEQASTADVPSYMQRALEKLSKVNYAQHDARAINDILREYNILTFIDNCLKYAFGLINEREMKDLYYYYNEYDKQFHESGIYHYISQYYHNGKLYSNINSCFLHSSIRYCRMLEMK